MAGKGHTSILSRLRGTKTKVDPKADQELQDFLLVQLMVSRM